MSFDPNAKEQIRDAQRKAAQKERAVDDLKAKVREVREIMGRFGIKERAPGEWIMDFGTLIASLGPDQATELAQELEAKGIKP